MAMVSTFLLVVAVVILVVSVTSAGSQEHNTAIITTVDHLLLLEQLPEVRGEENSLTDNHNHPLVEEEEDGFKGRKLKGGRRRLLLLKALVFLKALWLGVLMPLALIFALASSWQAATISLVALGSAAFLGLKTGPHPVHPPTSVAGWWQDRDWNLDPQEYKRRQ